MNYAKTLERYKAEHSWPDSATELDADLRRAFSASAESYEVELTQEQLEGKAGA